MLNGQTSQLYIGMMSGTSLDGVDAVLVDLSALAQGQRNLRVLAKHYLGFSAELRQLALTLQAPGENELERCARLNNHLAQVYANCAIALLQKSAIAAHAVRAIAVHGQTLRHRPELGYTWQANNPALLAELTGINVIADFRSRDVAAGGQGAPLVPAFHRAIFSSAERNRVVVNIGGISNISILGSQGETTGFDTGPGNVLLDGWIQSQQGLAYDAAGAWAAQGQVQTNLLQSLLSEAFFTMPPPKSTGRDLFHMQWLYQHLQACPGLAAVDVQATLAEFTAISIADAIQQYSDGVREVYVCGGGAYNLDLLARLGRHLPRTKIASSAELGVLPELVEALAFAWLGQQFVLGLPGNLPAVTGAHSARILGACYPA